MAVSRCPHHLPLLMPPVPLCEDILSVIYFDFKAVVINKPIYEANYGKLGSGIYHGPTDYTFRFFDVKAGKNPDVQHQDFADRTESIYRVPM